MKKIVLISFFIILATTSVMSQQEPVYSQFTMNQFLINPAFAGSEGYTSFNLTARQQWLGMEDAPSTQSISGQARILKTSYISKSRSIKKRIKKRRPSGRVGIGAYIYNDKNGQIGKTGGEFTYAYHLFINDGQLSLGVSLSAFQFRVNTENLILPQGETVDPLLLQAREGMWVTDGSFGLYYTFQPFYVGLSSRNLFQSALKFGEDDSFKDYQQLRHYYFITGYRYDMKNDFEIEPSVLFKTTENFFDYSLNDIQRISYGSHEIMVGLKFGDNQRRYRWLNRF